MRSDCRGARNENKGIKKEIFLFPGKMREGKGWLPSRMCKKEKGMERAFSPTEKNKVTTFVQFTLQHLSKVLTCQVIGVLSHCQSPRQGFKFKTQVFDADANELCNSFFSF